MLRRISGLKKSEIIRGWGKLHMWSFVTCNSSPNIIRMIKSRRVGCADRVTQMGEKLNTCRILEGKPEGKRPLRRTRCRWKKC
jgi:hypothetical protein